MSKTLPDYSSALGLQDFRVDTYNSSHQAIRNFSPGLYDLAILDFKLPGMDGFTLYEKMLDIDQKIKVLFISGDNVHYEAKKLSHLELESRHYLTKPAKLSELVERIKEILHS